MEFDTVKTKKVSDDNVINLYLDPPFGQLTLGECEDLFRQRLEALHIVETKSPLGPESFRPIKSYAFKTNCIITNKKDKQIQKQDHYSHMLMRMYCIHNPDLWQWFKTNERKLLLYRLKDCIGSLSGNHLENILNSFNFEFERVIGGELSNLTKENTVGWNNRDQHRDSQDIFKVRFTDALYFVSKRLVALKDGYAFLTKNDIISVVGQVFEKHLDGELIYARRHLNTESLQVIQLLDAMRTVYLEHEDVIYQAKREARKDAQENSRNPYKIDIADIDDVARRHFPPCMRHLHEALTQDNHLRHFGRIHYTTFLRSGGVDLDSATEFWRKHLLKKMSEKEFDRDHKYNIRHLYGREGHKKALSSYTCGKIINSNAPGPIDKHGCPFKHFDDNHLKTLLQKHNVNEVDIESIMTKNKDNNQERHQMACTEYFKSLKGYLPSETIRNPIQFYYESQRIANRPVKVDEGDNLMEHGSENDLGSGIDTGVVSIENASEEFMD